MQEIITRFAPSPTGMLHIGNIRTALINFLYTKKYGGKFILRIDDTDILRSQKEFEIAIKQDLKKLGLNWDYSFNQTSKLDRYEEVKKQLIADGRLYACYETKEELDIKRKLQLSNGRPPIYDRAALALTEEKIKQYEEEGRTPHYRFLINDAEIKWHDLIKGEIYYEGKNLSDPVIIRADGTMTYMLCSTIDDVDAKISHVIRGEDHVSNTAMQIQIFQALKAKTPEFAHLSLIKTKDDKISKRTGGHDVRSMTEQDGIMPMSINSFLALIGSSKNLNAFKNMQELIDEFDIKCYSLSPTTYSPDDLLQINHKIISMLEYEEVEQDLKQLEIDIDKNFWNVIKPNLSKIRDAKNWWEICNNHQKTDHDLNNLVLKSAINLLPEILDGNSWKKWTKSITDDTAIKGKEMFMTLRLAITGIESGPELKLLLPLLKREEIISRLKYYL